MRAVGGRAAVNHRLQVPLRLILRRNLRLKLRTLSPELGRTLAEKIGINDNIFQMLVATNKQLEALNKNYIITKDQIKALRDLDGQWRNLKWSVEQVKNQFAAALAPALAILAQALEKVVGYLAMFAQWITADTYAAKGFRLVLGVVTIGALALGAALAMLATAFAVLAVAPAIAAITTALVEFLLPFAPIIAVIGALLLLLDDANTAFTGGQSFFGKDQWTQALMGLTNITRSLKIVYDLIVAVSQAIQNPARTMKQLGDTFDSATGRMLTSLNPISNALRIVLGPWKEIGQAIEQAYIKTKLFVTLFANMTGITAMLHRVKESLSGIFSWTDKIAALNPLPPGLKMLHDMWTAIASAIESAYTKVKLFLEVISGASNLSKMFERIAQAIPGIGAAATDKSLGNIIPSKSTASNTSNQTNAIQVHVEGSGDPVATGKHVVNNIAKAVQTAYRQMPNPAY